MNIALIVPSGIVGGVSTVFHNLHRGLVNEGVSVDVIRLRTGRFPLLSTTFDDFLETKFLRGHDLALYIGSIPWPSHMMARFLGVPIALFLHGYIYPELFHVILYGARLRDKIGAAITATMFNVAVSLNTIDLYICPSLAVCEANKISDRFVLLPQWIFPDELKLLETALDFKKSNVIRIVSYISYADSPRILNMKHLVVLAQVLKRMVKREFELIIVNPKGFISSFDTVKIVGSMPRQKFLSLLASADLYIERGIDEDLGQVVLEAMAMGTPVAKLTHQKYWHRQDFRENLILASSFRDLAEKISEYIDNIDHYYYHYSERGREFVLSKRTWDAVKMPFLRALKHISQ